MGDGETFHVNWKDHARASLGTLYRFQREDRFSDVTLHCEDRCIQAHRVVLAACSSYFERVLDRIAGDSTAAAANHVAIVLKSVPGELFDYCVQFIYYGDLTVPFNKLAAFMALARELEIHGLSDTDLDGEEEHEQLATVKPRKPAGAAAGSKSGEVLAALQPSNVGGGGLSLKRKPARNDGGIAKRPALDLVSVVFTWIQK
jgi:hypothetical protein